ncbi:LysE family translocator [Oceanobacter mangrovi]|uniref:LysE family translocator n=1 Tax=Oceanobacter mangrovi TaxID=2862510 RepID=UPI001C8ED16B|nr:LysE family transporter [Oceanobacter mangrovi]
MEAGLIGMFVTVALAHFLALLSPGPDFVLLVKNSVRHGVRSSVGVAGGIALANAVYILLCLAGVGSLLAASLPVMIALKILGGLFLVYLAVMALAARKSSYQDIAVGGSAEASGQPVLSGFATGFMSGILNPKNLLFYLSLFTVVLTPDVNHGFKWLLGAWMTLVVFCWDVAVVYLLSGARVRQHFSRLAFYIDKVTGVILGAIGLSIVKSSLSR